MKEWNRIAFWTMFGVVMLGFVNTQMNDTAYVVLYFVATIFTIIVSIVNLIEDKTDKKFAIMSLVVASLLLFIGLFLFAMGFIQGMMMYGGLR